MKVCIMFTLTALLWGSTAEAKELPGTFKATAKLIKIPGKLPPDDLYDYAYVMKYLVIGGKLDKQKLYVAHYKPRQARGKITGKMKKVVGGKLKRFKEGAVHELTLSPHMRKAFKGAVVDEFFATDRKSARYWCLRVDPSKTK